MELRGKYGAAIVHTDEIENEAISQIINLMNQPMAENAHVRIMPDVHYGSGCVIGYTAKLGDKIVPNLIGVDIGCGVTGYHIGHVSKLGKPFDKLDKFIRANIPSGMKANDRMDRDELETVFNTFGKGKGSKFRHFKDFSEAVDEVVDKMNMKKQYIFNSIGTLGGGNHFYEIDETEDGELYMVVHSGSRGFGKNVAEWHQRVAVHAQVTVSREEFEAHIEHIKKTKKGKGIQVAIEEYRRTVSKKMPKDLEYVSGVEAQAYYKDMHIAQTYAALNRRVMLHRVVTGFYKQQYNVDKITESVHNYINFEDGIVRKGAISAHKGEKVIIPLNMADGIILGIGKGNEDFNNSSAHGAGRKMSRSKAKASIRLEDFQFRMREAGVWSTCIGTDTLDESPQAYKKAEKIIELLEPTVEVTSHMKPVYVFKAGEEHRREDI